MNKSFSIVLALGAALLAAPAWSGNERPVDERRPLKADARVSVSNIAGRIDVEAWDRNELHLTGSLSEQVEKLEISGGESSLRIEVRVPKDTRNLEDTILKLKVPAGISLEAEAVSADVTVKGLRGAVEVESVSGDVRVDVASERVKAASVSGDVQVQAPTREARLSSVSGDVAVRGARGTLRAETVSGDVHVQAGRLDELDVESVSGDIEVSAELADAAEVSVETLSGEVSLHVPALPDGELRMQTFSGELHSDFGNLRGGAREFRQEGKGRARVKLNSFSGDIRVRKK